MVKGITYILKNNAGVQALVGQNAAGDKYKVYPVVAPASETHPFITVSQTGRSPIESKEAPNTRIYTYDVVSYSENYDGAEAIDNAVIAALDFTEGTFNGVEFQEIRHTNTVDGNAAPDGLYSKISSFEAWVNED